MDIDVWKAVNFSGMIYMLEYLNFDIALASQGRIPCNNHASFRFA